MGRNSTQQVRLLTVKGTSGSVDVCVAADVPVRRLLPALVDLVGVGQLERDHPHWQLQRPDGRQVRRAASLADQCIEDGMVLTLALALPLC